MLRDEDVGFGPQCGRQHPARPVTRDLGQRIIHRFRLTQSDDVVIVLHGVSFLLEVLAGLITRHDTPPSQTPSPISRHSSGIVAVILLPPTKRLDVLRRDDPDLMAKRLELALPIKCAGASLDTNHTGRDLCDSPKKCLPPHTSA